MPIRKAGRHHVMIRYVIALPLTFGLAVWFMYRIFKALRSGVSTVRGIKFRKKEHPFWYDLTIVVKVLSAGVFFGLFAKLVREFLRYGLR